MSATQSPFFHTSTTASADSLAILHLRRDTSLPVTLRTTADDGYAEGAVINTRFGSYPHSTLIGTPWGTQVRASKVDTGTRGRLSKSAIKNEPGAQAQHPDLKRKADNHSEDRSGSSKRHKTNGEAAKSIESSRAPVEAGSGFTHLLPPTPENWTASLDHRTQVVYVPDASYILSRLRVKPGEILIEAGAGSGSFTHAAARAVFNGYPTAPSDREHGRVYSFEYHEPRAQALRKELEEHRLDSVVTLTHRDVCQEGFFLPDTMADAPKATVVFLDLPAPWTALQHLKHDTPRSPLSSTAPIRICTFSPCIEQVTATVAALRANGWVEVQMAEVQNRRIDVRRERVGLQEEGLRGVNAVAASVEESMNRLRDVELKLKDFHSAVKVSRNDEKSRKALQSKAERLEQNKKDAQSRALYKEGRLIHRTENEVKTHTSYLVFAILPRRWIDADENACKEMWPSVQKSL